jgi:glycosyltransferase involved in cell wall biosynthesis
MSVDEAPGRALSRRLPGATVLQIVPALVDEPAARAAVNVASALLRSGARAIVAAEPGMLVGQLQALGGEWVRLHSRTLNPLKLRSNAHRLSELIAGERVDVVHAYSGPAAYSARNAIGETAAWLVTSYLGAPPAGLDLGSLYQGSLVRGHRTLADSDYAADLIVQRYGIDPSHVIAIPRSIDTARFDPTAVSAERLAVLRHGWGIRPGWRVVLVPGRLLPAKGQMNVVDAVRILINGGMLGIAFVVAGANGGDGDYAKEIARRIAAQGIGGVVRLVGHCSDMAAAYAIADLVIVPSIAPTTFSEIAAEALAMAKPVIASAIGVLPELVIAPPRAEEEARTGWLAPPGDPIALARAIAAALATDPAVRRVIAARARRFAEQRFAPQRVAAATLEVYAGLLEGAR